MKHEVVFGVHAVAAVLEQRPEAIREAWCQQGIQNPRIKALLSQLSSLGVKPQVVKKAALDRESSGGAHQGIAVKVNSKPLLTESDLFNSLSQADLQQNPPLYLILDCLDDPQNMGACLRTAECAGVAGVIVTKDKTPNVSLATVRKVACGAVDILPIYQVTNLAATLKRMKEEGVWVVGTACNDQAQPFYQVDLTGPLAVIMGSEGKGLRRLTQELCDFVAYIPLSGSIDSLNVSVATGIALFEARRQRLLAEAAQPA